MTNKKFEALIEELREGMKTLKSIPAEVSPERAQDVYDVYNIMKYLLKEQDDAKVSYEICKDIFDAATVTVVADSIYIKEPQLFTRATLIADNFNVYPQVTGKVRLDFLFKNILRAL